MSPPVNAVKRACDACHRRKVKCDGVNPCRNCAVAQLSCTYNAIPQKKGPKGSRAKVISELRENQRLNSLAARVHNRINNVPAPKNPTLEPSSGILTGESVKESLNFFFDHLYGKAPILDRRSIEAAIPFMEQNRDVYCLMASLCAYTLLQPGMVMNSLNEPYNTNMNTGANVIAASLLIEEAERVRKGYEYMESVSLNTIATSFFLASSHAIMESQNKAWVEVRKATTMIHIANWHLEETYNKLDVAEAARTRRLYWMIFVMERLYAFSRSRPVTLDASIHPPTLGDDPSDPLAPTLAGFITLVNIFRSLSSFELSTWAQARKTLNAQHITSLSTQVGDALEQLRRQDPNALDPHVNQSWLKDVLWRITSTGRANSQGSADGLGFEFPADAGRELLFALSSQFSGHGMEFMMNGGLMKTLIETLSNMIDLVSFTPHIRGAYRLGPREHLDELIGIVAIVRSGAQQFLPLLFHKAAETLARVAHPMLDDVPESLTMANMNCDIFDGFGNAGMAQVPQMQMSMEPPMMGMETPMQTPMQMQNDQHTPSHAPYESSPPIQLPIDPQSTASMQIKIEPQPTPRMQIPMDTRCLSHQHQQHQHQHQHQRQQHQHQHQHQQHQPQQQQMQIQIPLDYDASFGSVMLDQNFAAISNDPSMRAQIQGSMPDDLQSEMQAMNSNMSNMDMSSIMQIPQNMMGNEHGSFWS